MSRTDESSARIKVGDLVYLSYDALRMVGYGIVLSPSVSPNTSLVYWFIEGREMLEHHDDLLVASVAIPK
jgi:hypothetical protein